MARTILTLTTTIALALHSTLTWATDCSITVGIVMELTGVAGEYGQAAAKSVEMAFRDLNDAGGPQTCRLVTETKDSQSQGMVGVDAANQLVQIKHVPVLIGGIISSVTIPILTSVTGPAKVVQVSPAASSPKLTALGREGKTGGMFFRTITSDALQGSVAAKYALDRGLRRLAVIYVNNDFGVGLYTEFAHAYQALGGVITSATRYNEKQASYGSEVTAAMSAPTDGLYLIATPVEGATIARNWISLGGPRRFLLNDGLNSAEFIVAVGAKYLNEAYGTSSGTNPSASTQYFDEQYRAFAHRDPASPAADRSYDAGAIVGLALAVATRAAPGASVKSDARSESAVRPESAAIRAAIFQVTDPHGSVIHAGRSEFVRALAFIKDGKPIRYEGVIGPVSFDDYGDITGPFRLWRITNGVVSTVGEMRADEVSALKARIGG